MRFMHRPQFGQELQLREEREGNFLILHIGEDRLDATNAMIFQAHLIHRIAAGNDHILVDLSEVEAVDQEGIDVLRMGLQAVGPSGDLVLCGVTEPVMKTLRNTLMNRIFGIFVGPDEALSALT